MAVRSCSSRDPCDESVADRALNWRSISLSRNRSRSPRTPSCSSDRSANCRKRSRVSRSSASSEGGSGAGCFTSIVRSRGGTSHKACTGASSTTNEPGVCSRCCRTTPRCLSRWSKPSTALRTTDTPLSLLLPRPVITSTSGSRSAAATSICRCRSHDSARATASAAVGNVSRRFNVRPPPKRASSNA